MRSDRTFGIEGLAVEIGYPLKERNSFKVGGTCDYALFPYVESALVSAVDLLTEKRIPFVVIGGGNNILVSDGGYSGAVIFTEKLSKISVDNRVIRAGAGASLKSVFLTALDGSLTGLEELGGVPSSVGGAVKMNAGAFGTQTASLLSEVRTVFGGRIITYRPPFKGFSYRTSPFKAGEIILSAAFVLKDGDKGEITEKYRRYLKERRAKQPAGRTCGSVFKNPDTLKAGALLEGAGLKGRTVGNACFSEKHANFIINRGDSASDIKRLIEIGKERVKAAYGIELKEEVIYIGEF